MLYQTRLAAEQACDRMNAKANHPLVVVVRLIDGWTVSQAHSTHAIWKRNVRAHLVSLNRRAV